MKSVTAEFTMNYEQRFYKDIVLLLFNRNSVNHDQTESVAPPGAVRVWQSITCARDFLRQDSLIVLDYPKYKIVTVKRRVEFNIIWQETGPPTE